MSSRREAVTRGSSWRTEPAAGVRGVAHIGGAQPHRDAADRAEVLGDVLAAGAVAAGGSLGEAAALVDQGHGEAVDLGLDDHIERLDFGEAGGALVPGP